MVVYGVLTALGIIGSLSAGISFFDAVLYTFAAVSTGGFAPHDGSQPDILREVNPEQTDFLFCLTDSDQANLIANLVGRSLGFKRIVTSIDDPQFVGICHELGLKDTIIP
ncbi:MAG: hypothetical protein D3908_04625, partial [Candidatus Electrothrix sp. AUS4]|nr:hypothetical protein [Candidatus Electrothrix sp. AUS4]